MVTLGRSAVPKMGQGSSLGNNRPTFFLGLCGKGVQDGSILGIEEEGRLWSNLEF